MVKDTVLTKFESKTSKSINQYVKTLLDSNRRTGYEYLRRLEHFENFIEENYKFSVDELIENSGNKINIYNLLSSYVSYLINSTSDDGRSISNLTVKQKVITVKNFLEYHDIEISPRKFKLKIKFPKVVQKYKEALSKQDVQKILESCRSIKLKTYVLFLAATGTRATEACSIRLMDIDFNNSKVHIRGDFTKTKVDRSVYLTTELINQLKLWIDYKYRERRRYLTEDRKNTFFKPQRHDTDLVFSSSVSIEERQHKADHRKLNSLYNTYGGEFSKLIDRLKIGYEDNNKRRRKITLHSFRRFVFTVISDLGYNDFSNFYIGHAQSTYWRKPEKEKFELFKRIEPSLTYLDQTGLEKKHADLQSRLEAMEHENLNLQKVLRNREVKEVKDDDIIASLGDKVMLLTKEIEKMKQDSVDK
jgi:integrase